MSSPVMSETLSAMYLRSYVSMWSIKVVTNALRGWCRVQFGCTKDNEGLGKTFLIFSYT